MAALVRYSYCDVLRSTFLS